MEETKVQSIAANPADVGALIAALSVAWFTTPYMGVSTLAFLLMWRGFSQRKINRKAHALYMSSTIFLDLAVVLTLEIQRSAINTAASFTLEPLQQLHILFSSLAVTLYFPAAIIGYLRYNNKIHGIKSLMAHKYCGYGILTFRTIGFALMFTMLG